MPDKGKQSRTDQPQWRPSATAHKPAPTNQKSSGQDHNRGKQ